MASLTSTETGLADGWDDSKLLSSSSQATNDIRQGGNTQGTTGSYTESMIETSLTDPNIQATNDQTQTWAGVTLEANEHYVFAMPSRLSTPDFFDADTGFAFDMQSPATLEITNSAGFKENYKIFVSTEILGAATINLRTA